VTLLKVRIKSAISFLSIPMRAFQALRSSIRFALACSFVALTGCASRATAPSTAAEAPSVANKHTAAETPADLLAEGGTERIAAIHRSKCGSCHTPVEPGSLQHDTAEAAMQRHRRRAKLSERDWADMVEFLSADGSVHARHTARVP
jgi:hypothetical protein